MIKAILADNDMESLKNFKAYLRASAPDVRVVASISDNKALASAVRDFKPELILADIRFFGTYAVQTIRGLNETYADMRFIIYGTYNDAEYIEKVLEYGVIDYMFRPVKPAELDRCLQRAIKVFAEMAKLEAANKRLIADYKNEMSAFKQRFLDCLLDGVLESESEIELSMRYFGIALPPPYTVVNLRIDHFKTVILALDEQEKHLLIYRLLMLVNEKLSRYGNGLATMNRFNSISIILSGEQALYPLIDFCEEIKTEALYQTRFAVTMGIGRTYPAARQIAVSAREADAALRFRHYMGYNTVIPIHFVDPLNTVTYHYPKEKEELLIYAAVTGEYDYCESLLRKLLDALKQCPELPDRHLPRIIMHILIAIARYAGEQRMPNETIFTKFFNSKEIFELKTLDDAYTYLSAALKNFCGYMVEVRNENKIRIVDKVKEYINTHSRENITLSGMAMFAETTAEFLGNVFREREKCSVYEYTTRVKLERAKRLMRETAMDDETIANDVGYDDLRLFRNLFRQHTNLFTHEYRMQMIRLGEKTMNPY